MSLQQGFLSLTTKATITNIFNKRLLIHSYCPTVANWKIHQEVTEKLQLASGTRSQRSCMFTASVSSKRGLARNANSRPISTDNSANCHAEGEDKGQSER